MAHFETDRERREGWSDLATKIGKRYSVCRVENYEASSEAQRDAVASITSYVENMPSEVEKGRGVVLYGPEGTGKDHLLVPLMGVAISRHGFSVEWANGVDLFGRLRDTIGSDRLEEDFVRPFVSADVLALSDPVPPWGPLTPFQASFLFRVIDARYRQMKPTWVTINVSGGDEAANRLGSQIVGRLRDGSLTIHCNWPSHRKSKERQA